MQRWMLPAGIALVAGFAIWHPARQSGPAITQVPSQKLGHSRRVRAARAVGPTGAVVYVVGAVVRPGLYTIVTPARVEVAVRAAGGFAGDADPSGVNLAAFTADGDEIDVPRVGEVVRTRAVRTRRTTRSRIASQPPQVVDPNFADAQALASVPGLGPALAARIVTYRQVNGPFADLDELLDVGGMTPAKLDRAQSYLQITTNP